MDSERDASSSVRPTAVRQARSDQGNPCQREDRARNTVAVAAALVAVLQGLGVMGWIAWSPAMLLAGGFDRFIDFGDALGWRIAHWAQSLSDLVWMLYFVMLSLASSRWSQCVRPEATGGAEVGRYLRQHRRVWADRVGAVVVVHGVGIWLDHAGWWPVAALLEMLGHVSTALLLYVLTVPEARCALVVIRDHRHQGLNNRFHIGRPGRLGQFRWIDVHHRRFKGVKVQDTLWQRVLGLASLEVSYLDEHGHQCHTVLQGIGTKQEVTVVTAYLAGEFRVRDQYVPPPTSRSEGSEARTHATPEQRVSTDLISQP